MTSLVSRVLVVLSAVYLGTACRKAPQEAAPVKPGDFFDYKFTASGGLDTSYYAQIKIDAGPSAGTFKILGVPDAGEPPVEVDAALDPGKRIKIHFIGQLWLPPSQRIVGAQTRVGNVNRKQSLEGRQVWVAEEAGKWPFYFDQSTGFLVGYSQPSGGGQIQARLLKSSIQAL